MGCGENLAERRERISGINPCSDQTNQQTESKYMKNKKSRLGLSILAGGLSFVGGAQGANLLLNSSFESNGTTFNPPVYTDWIGYFGTYNNSSQAYFSGPNIPASEGPGYYYAWEQSSNTGTGGGTWNSFSTPTDWTTFLTMDLQFALSQTVSLTNVLTGAAIDAGRGSYTLSAWMATYGPEMPCVVLNFFDDTMTTQIGSSVVFDRTTNIFAVTYANGTTTIPANLVSPLDKNWIKYVTTATVPANARNATVYITRSPNAGLSGAPDTYVDLVKLDVIDTNAAPSLSRGVPSSLPVYAGGNARIPVQVAGPPPISYQWRSNSVPLLGQTNTSLTISNVQLAYTGTRYSVVLSNAIGVTTNGDCVLNVLSAPALSTAAVMANLQPLGYWRFGTLDTSAFAFDYLQGYHGYYQTATPGQLPGALTADDDGACALAGTGSQYTGTGGALYGAGSCVTVSPDLPVNFTTNAFTLVTWAQPASLTGVQRLFSNRASLGGYGFGFNGNTRLRFTGYKVADVDSSVGTFNVGQWYHIAVVRTGTSLSFYVNGAQVSTATISKINPSANPLQFGGSMNGTEYFTGLMDEAAVFNYALSGAQIAALYAAQYGSLVGPGIVQNPASDIIYAGGTARFSVVASGSQPLGYQWQTNGVAMRGATNATLALPNVTSGMNSMTCSVTVSNRVSTTNSTVANLTVLSPSGYETAVAPDAPVALWRLDESAGPTVYDQLGSHNGTAYNSIAFGQPGAIGNDPDTCLGFDGSSAEVEVPYSADLNPATFSVECWARVTGDTYTYQAAVSSRNISQGSFYAYTTSEGYVLYASPFTGNWEFWTYNDIAGAQVQSGTPVVQNQWTHLVGTFDGLNKKFYINGALVASEVNPNYQPNLICNLRIGEGNNENDPTLATHYNFLGNLDEVAVYNYALPANRVLAHFLASDPAPVFSLQPANVVSAENVAASFSCSAYGPGTTAYQWYQSTDGGSTFALMSGATTTTLTLPSVSAGMNGYVYQVVATNTYGSTISSNATLTVLSGAPQIIPPDLPAAQTVVAGRTLSLALDVGGTAPFTCQWLYNGTNLHNGGRISGAQSNVLTITDVQMTDAGAYKLSILNAQSAGIPTNSVEDAISVVNGATSLNTNGQFWTVNGGAAIDSDVLTLTDGLNNEARSSFYNAPLYIGAFVASFTYQATVGSGALADGAAFILQNDPHGPTALGGTGGDLGVSGIEPSAEFDFNLYSGQITSTAPPLTVGTAFHVNGANNFRYTTTSPVNLASGHPINVVVNYANGVAQLTLTDTTASTTFTTNLNVGNLPSLLGSDTAYVGFSGATGGYNANQSVSNFWFAPVVTLSAQLTTTNTVLFTWPADAGGFVLQARSDLNSGTWQSVLASGVSGQAIVSASAAKQFYRLALP